MYLFRSLSLWAGSCFKIKEKTNKDITCKRWIFIWKSGKLTINEGVVGRILLLQVNIHGNEPGLD